MGKAIIIKNVDYSANRVAKINLPTDLVPTIRFNEGFWNYLTGLWMDSSTGNLNRNCNRYYLKVVPNKQYKIYFNTTGVNFDIPYYNVNKEIQGHWGGTGTSESYTTEPITLNIPDGVYYICFDLYTASSDGQNLTGKIEIIGSTDDALIEEEAE